MKILLLGGQSERNVQWLQALAEELRQFDLGTVDTHEYQGWKTTPLTDEAKQLAVEVGNVRKNKAYKNYDVVVGKSYGCAVALASAIPTKALVLIGPPTKLLKAKFDLDLCVVLAKRDTITLVLANVSDPLVDVPELIQFAGSEPGHCELVLADGIGHAYNELPSIAQKITEFCRTQGFVM